MADKEAILEKVRELIGPLFDEKFYHLVDLELRGSGNRRVLCVYADTEKGITLAEITRLTQEISDILDLHDVIPASYRLEVSSPGVHRPLTHPWQFRKNIGRLLQVRYQEADLRKEVTGELIRVQGEAIVLRLKTQEVTVPLSAIELAKVKIKW